MNIHADNTRSADEISIHRPVMVHEVLEWLNPKDGDALLDLTMGTGGHSLAVGGRIGREGMIVGMDADEGALKVASERLKKAVDCPIRLFHGRFSEAGEVLKQVGIKGFDLMIADLGLGSHQLDALERGFSFESDAKLDMRFDTAAGRSARDVLHEEPEEALADIFYHLGQERFSRQIASAVCRRRRLRPIDSARELADIAKKVYAARSGGRRWRIHPATRVFMALRIYVNDELNELDALLDLLPDLAAQGARCALITYHSLEARRVKQSWRRLSEQERLDVLTPRPVAPGEDEISGNPRARSAQLRVAGFS